MRHIIVLTIFVALVASKSFERIPSITTIEELEVKQHSRIISGKPAVAGQFPWQVANNFSFGLGTVFCGGSLICDSWVLTAGHCAKDVSHFTLYFGSVNQSQEVEEGRVVLETDSAVVHPDYNEFNLNHDIALIRLKQKVNSTSRIKVIPLSTNVIPANVTLRVSGWGKTSDASNSVSPILNYVDLTSISNEDCAKVYGSAIINETICCKGNPEHSTCNGDSGGPLIDLETNRQVGVVSFVSSKGCASGNPSGYVRVAPYSNWILETINGTCTLPN